jgi:inner membrane transporter RhtA
MDPAAGNTDRRRLAALAGVVAAMASIQVGAGLAKSLFAQVGPEGIAALRLVFAALILIAVWRPWRTPPPPRARGWILCYGLALGAMNLCFYLALERLPLGVAVALELSGPLTLALVGSRRLRDGLWVLLAVGGLLLLTPWTPGAATDPVGVGFGLAAGACWALYILFGRRAGLAHGGGAVACGMVVAALVAAPVGLVDAAPALLAPAVLSVALAVAVLSSALPYSLEMMALSRLPTRTFSVMMSLEPALGALTGFLILGERLTPLQGLATASLVVASMGAAATMGSGRGSGENQPVA